jgi:tetratricopeptide (TPR) repeat protein
MPALRFTVVALVFSAAVSAQPQPESLRQAQQLMIAGKMDQALALYRHAVQASPDSRRVSNAAGIAFDLAGQYAEARKYFAKAIDLAPDGASKAQAHRALAMSYAFEGDCKNAAKYEQMAIDYWVTRSESDPHNAFYQQGEVADEAARVCLDNGYLDEAYKWYKAGHDLGLKEPDIASDRKSLWEFRWEHGQARIAAQRGNKAEAQKHLARARAILDKDREMAKGQEQFFPYLAGYVALYTGDSKTALEQLLKAQQNDPFIQCLIGQAYEKLGNKEKATEAYKKAAATTNHNSPAAFARPFARKKLSHIQ